MIPKFNTETHSQAGEPLPKFDCRTCERVPFVFWVNEKSIGTTSKKEFSERKWDRKFEVENPYVQYAQQYSVDIENIYDKKRNIHLS